MAGKQRDKSALIMPPAANQLVVYPNPVGSERLLRLSLPEVTGGYQIALRSISGQVVVRWQGRKNDLELDLSSIAPGLYFISARSGTETWTKKVVIR